MPETKRILFFVAAAMPSRDESAAIFALVDAGHDVQVESVEKLDLSGPFPEEAFDGISEVMGVPPQGVRDAAMECGVKVPMPTMQTPPPASFAPPVGQTINAEDDAP